MDENKVITIDGSEELRIKCRNIKGVFYRIGELSVENSGHCYFINDKFYKFDTGYIVFDHYLKQYVIKNNNNLSEGVVSFENKNVPIIGYFSNINNESTKINYKGVEYPCFNDEILVNSNFIEDLQTGVFYHRQSLPSMRFIRIGNIPNGLKNTLQYDSRNLTKNKSILYEKLYVPKYSESVENYGDILKDLTFGLEFETINGFVPTRICDKLGLIPLKDGSIQGLEYVTIPLQGKKGMQSLIDSIKELSKRTTYNDDCSLHLHIGNIPRTEEFFLALYKMLVLMEQPMYELFPVYKKYNYGVKRKHYTKPFSLNETIYLMDPVINKSNIKQNFSVLYNYLSMGQNYSDRESDLKNVHSHPSDPNGDSKWNIRTRYHWVNMIPLLFGNKQTVEFRLHTPTYDINKIMNYLVLCSSLINYVKENTQKILTDFKSVSTLNMTDLLYSTMPKDARGSDKYARLLNSVYGYINDRRDFMFNNAKRGNIKANEDEFVCRRGIWDTNNNIIKNPQEKSSNGLLDIVDNPYNPDRLRGRFNPFNHQIPDEAARLFGNADAYRDNIDQFIIQNGGNDLLVPLIEEEQQEEEDYNWGEL